MGRFRNALRATLSLWAEITVSIALLGGWTLLTWGIARLTSTDAWIFSGGVLLLSLIGWQPILTLVIKGLKGVSEADR